MTARQSTSSDATASCRVVTMAEKQHKATNTRRQHCHNGSMRRGPAISSAQFYLLPFLHPRAFSFDYVFCSSSSVFPSTRRQQRPAVKTLLEGVEGGFSLESLAMCSNRAGLRSLTFPHVRVRPPTTSGHLPIAGSSTTPASFLHPGDHRGSIYGQ